MPNAALTVPASNAPVTITIQVRVQPIALSQPALPVPRQILLTTSPTTTDRPWARGEALPGPEGC